MTRAQDTEDRPLLIWLDTLCCPVLPAEARSLALAQMRRTYQDARYVLVLDSDLQFYASGEITIFEALFRFFLSGWMSRLWTPQEASLARTIWIDFKDQPVEPNVLMAYMAQLGHADLAFLPFSVDIHRQFYSLRLDSPDNISNEESSSNPVAMSLPTIYQERYQGHTEMKLNLLTRTIVSPFRVSDRNLREKDVRLFDDTIRSNYESDVSPKQRSGFIQASIDTIVGAGVAVAIPEPASIDRGSKLPVRIDKHHWVIIPVHIDFSALGFWILTIVVRPTGIDDMMGRIASMIVVCKP